MAMSLRARLLAAYAIVIVAALAIMTVMASQEQRRWLIERQQEDLTRRLKRVVPAVAGRLAGAPEQAPAVADSLGAALECRVTIIDRSGWVRGDSEVPAAGLQ